MNKIAFVANILEKEGSLSFSSEMERGTFLKIAQGEMLGMGMDPNMLAQQAGVASMVDPQVASVAQQQGVPLQQADLASVPAPAGVETGAPTEETLVGESISNADIESLIKIINVLTSLKSKYDSMKKEQMNMLKQQSGEEING